jgi:hypothetical protein
MDDRANRLAGDRNNHDVFGEKLMKKLLDLLYKRSSIRISLSLLTIIAAIACLAATSAGAESLLRSTGACQPEDEESGACLKFPPLSTTVLRSITINAPGRGSVLVQLSGTGFCGSFSPSPRIVDFELQITNNPGADPDHTGPGGLRVAYGFPGVASASSSLGSSRVFPIRNAGPHTYYVLVELLRVDANITCWLYSANLSALFVPR